MTTALESSRVVIPALLCNLATTHTKRGHARATAVCAESQHPRGVQANAVGAGSPGTVGVLWELV